MSRESSAPQWAQPPENPNTWRRALLLEDPHARAKAIPRREISTATNVPTVMRTNEQGVIAPDHSPSGGSSQRRHDVQELREAEREILDVIVSLGGFASSRAIADVVGCSPRALLRRELHDLAVKGAIEAVHGHGWRVKK